MFSMFGEQPKQDNGLGGENNVVTVRGSDFEVFEALAIDSVSTGHQGSGKDNCIMGKSNKIMSYLSTCLDAVCQHHCCVQFISIQAIYKRKVLVLKFN